MENTDLSKVNNILRSSTASNLTAVEGQTSPAFNVDKDYYDFVLSILIARKATNSVMNQFYKVASSNNITYTNEYQIKPDIVGMSGG
jgi:hypothetical protein